MPFGKDPSRTATSAGCSESTPARRGPYSNPQWLRDSSRRWASGEPVAICQHVGDAIVPGSRPAGRARLKPPLEFNNRDQDRPRAAADDAEFRLDVLVEVVATDAKHL